MDEYWNHNTAYHAWLVGIAARLRGRVLDVGCGEGLLVQRLAAVSTDVLGIDPDPQSVRRARQRLRSVGNASVELTGFPGPDAARRPYDLITFVASLHHLPLRETLLEARRMLAPGGELAVVGLAANKSVADWVWSGLCTPPARAGSWLHGETRDIGVAVAQPRESLAEIRRAADDLLPGSRIRRGLYYRYRLKWRKP
ncbi:class I SAM-dependent methyltransferase [Mycobacterium sp. Marseille-P9652]|uniref:class I SAM-dependent methyltransferase n=1 Tax=Mycobacterium sp. Marseille-P9652 TaxID=2654950 RepID=UPI0012E845E8|nr:class I SAM-dependent methyltransferase [Mycobacterium sp. Marseille-P9652]